MTDQQLWDRGLRSVEKMLAGLHAADRQSLLELLAEYHQKKLSLSAITLNINSEKICEDCAGECCLNGKYRMNVLDALSIRVAGAKVLPDFLQKPLCPYGSGRGCKMGPGFRPAGCVFFICEALDRRLSAAERACLTTSENSIRTCLTRAARLLDVQVTTPLLLWAEENTYCENP